MRIAVLDLGSNSFHVLVADADVDGALRHVLREREMPRLGAIVAREGHVPEGDARLAAETVAQLRRVADAAGAERVVAIATSALRDAANGAEVLARLADAARTQVTLLDGHREAELSYRGVRASVSLPVGQVLAMDLGGGSLELVTAEGGRILRSASVAIGTARLAGELVSHDPLTRRERSRLRRVVEERLAPFTDEPVPSACVAAGGALRALGSLVAVGRWGHVPPSLNQLHLTADEILELRDRLATTSLDERLAIPGMKRRRADLIAVAAVIVAALVEQLAVDGLTLSDWGLREGVVLDAMGSEGGSRPPGRADDQRNVRPSAAVADAASVRDRAVRSMLTTFNADTAMAERVAAAAVAAFDDLGSDELTPADRELLRFAASLHGVGRSVSVRGHHRHAAYLVEHAGLRGFAPEEIAALVTLVRHQSSGEPTSSFPPFARIPHERRPAVVMLARLLQAVLEDPARGWGREDVDGAVA
jgi:exopolyphosphatase / guanosine-5'-triphosphate,3'-diphosphate pyrophosphatase